MSVKLGSGAINKIYLGATEAKKAYLGSTLIYDNTGGGGGTLSIALTDDRYTAIYPATGDKITGVAFGADVANRRVVSAVVTLSASSTFTIGGVAATKHSTTADGGYYRHIISATGVVGTSGDIVDTSGLSTQEVYGGITWSITGAASTLDQTTSGAANSGSLTVAAGGVVIAYHSRTSSTTITASSWTALTGTTPRHDGGSEYYSSGYGAFASAQTVNYSVTYTGQSGGVDQGNGAVSFKV